MIKDRNTRIAYNTIALYIRTFIVMVVSFLTSRVMLEQLGVEDYGLNNLISGVVSMFGFLNITMGTAVQRFFSVEEVTDGGVSAKKIFGSALLIHLSIGAVTLLLLEIFAVFFLERLNIPVDRVNVAQWVFQFASLTLVAGIVTVPQEAFLRAKEEFSILAIMDVLDSLFRLGILYCLYISPFDKLWTFSFLAFLVKILCNLTVWIISIIKYGEITRPYLYFEKSLFVRMMSFSLLLLFNIASSMVYWQGLVMMINIFFGVAINAAYGIGNQVKTAVDRFLANFKQSVVPQLMGSQASGDNDRLYKLIYGATKITFVLSLLIAMPVIFETEFILQIWLKTPPDFTVRFVQLGFVVSVISSVSFFVIQGIHATGKITGYSISVSCIYIVCLTMIYVLMKMGYGFYVPMYVSIIMETLVFVVTMIFAKRTYNFRVMEFLLKIMSRCLMFCVIMVACFVVMNMMFEAGWLRLCLNLGLSCVLSFSSLYILMDKYERDYVLSFVKKMLPWKRKD